MPIYRYKCTACGHWKEDFFLVTSEKEVDCPLCGGVGTFKRQFSTFAITGSAGRKGGVLYDDESNPRKEFLAAQKLEEGAGLIRPQEFAHLQAEAESLPDMTMKLERPIRHVIPKELKKKKLFTASWPKE